MKFSGSLLSIVFLSFLAVANGDYFENKCSQFVLSHQTRIEKVLNDTVKRHEAIKQTAKDLNKFARKQHLRYRLKAKISDCLRRQEETNDLIMTGVKCCNASGSTRYGNQFHNNILILLGFFAFCFLFRY
ncbi:unnamed protein product [Bursaphelenchus xylophilus]|uniref:(pine wood nematode) hypothetical protein n=1 Tax=Bursaphelenchus xylophilus TaxID=6326 RepID=A0A1I7RWC9_BURXY|nr:unnamed protein product [Bursaphelenchus xylophilus]CAG9095475.1 unnamed protein product [Bursaphelenchus xylophilus]